MLSIKEKIMLKYRFHEIVLFNILNGHLPELTYGLGRMHEVCLYYRLQALRSDEHNNKENREYLIWLKVEGYELLM